MLRVVNPTDLAPAGPRLHVARSGVFRERWAAYRDLLVAHLADLARRWPVLVLSDLPGNIGDRLIWAGTDVLLETAGIRARRVPVVAMSRMTTRNACLVVPGSGALTSIWHEWLPALVAKAADRCARVVILPSEFDDSVPVVAGALARPNVFAFARDPVSYARIRRFGRAVLAFDPALYTTRLPGPETAVSPLHPGVPRRLVAFREDAASLLAHHGCRPEPRVNRDIGRHARDLDEFLAAIESVDEVVTDRLHVALAALMSGRRVRFLDPHARKISTYVSFVFRDEFPDRIRSCTIPWLLERGLVARET